MASVDWHLIQTIARLRYESLPQHFFTAQTPPSSNAFPGRIVSREGPLSLVVTPAGELSTRPSGRLTYQIDLGSVPPPTVGDYVELDGADGRIDRVLPRATRMIRKEAGERSVAQTLASNIDMALFVTTVPEERDYSIRRLERFLATLAGEIPAIVVLNKLDLSAEPEAVVGATRAQLPGTCVIAVSATKGTGLLQLMELMPTEATIAIAGSSGTGKSTLTGRLAEEEIAVGGVRENDTRGRHTTTTRKSYRLPGNRLLIDMPGVREVQLWTEGAPNQQLEQPFPEIAALAAACRFTDCSHRSEPGCAVREAVQQEQIPHNRYLSYLELRRELDSGSDRSEKRERLNERRRARKSRMARHSRGGGV